MRSMAEPQAGDAALVALERALRIALVSEPGPEAVASMDRRFAVALQAPTASAVGRPGSPRRISRVLLVAASLFVLAGAGAVALQRFEGWSAPDFNVAWERGAVLGLTDQVDGYEVTLERAYADAGQVMLATAAEDLLHRAGVTQVAALSSNWTLVDDRGLTYAEKAGTSGPMSPSESAELFYFAPPTLPLAPGPRHFTLTLDEIGVRDDSLEQMTVAPRASDSLEVADPWDTVKGPWIFEFDLDVAGGTLVQTGSRSANVGGAAIGVETMLVTPTRLRLGLRVVGLEDAAAWEPVEVIARHGSTTIAFAENEHVGDGTTNASSYEGVDDPSGEWTITVGELVGPAIGPVPTLRSDGSFESHHQRIRGPWTVEVTVP